MRLQTKLVVVGCLLVVIPLAIVASMTYFQNKTILNTTMKETMNQAYTDLDHMAASVYNLVESHQEVNEKSIKNSLNVARAIGTFIPGVNSDGKPNPVTATVMKGETFTGRAFVVNGWYITS